MPSRLTVRMVCGLYAELVGVRPLSPETVRRAYRSGALAGRRVAGGLVFDRPAVLSWFRRHWPGCLGEDIA